MRRGAARVVPVAVLATVLALGGCGDPGEDYCSALAEDNKRIAGTIASDSPSALLDLLPTFRELAEKAPRDLTDEWDTYVRALDRLDDALRAAGVEADDFEDGKAPAGLAAADQRAIAEAAGKIGADEVVQASRGIEQQATDVCKLNLGLG